MTATTTEPTERQTIHLVIEQLQKKKPSDTIDTDQLRKSAAHH